MRLRGAPAGLFSSAAGWCSLIGVSAGGRGKRRRCLRPSKCARTLPSGEGPAPGPPSPAAGETWSRAEVGLSAGGPSAVWISSPGVASAVPVPGLDPRRRRRRRLKGSPALCGLAEGSSGCGAAPASCGGRRRRRRRGRLGGSPPTTVSACGSAPSLASSSTRCGWAEVAGACSPLAAGDIGLTRSLGGSSGECDISRILEGGYGTGARSRQEARLLIADAATFTVSGQCVRAPPAGRRNDRAARPRRAIQAQLGRNHSASARVVLRPREQPRHHFHYPRSWRSR